MAVAQIVPLHRPTFSLLICGEPARNGLGGNERNINSFLKLLKNDHPYTVVNESRNGEDCYIADIIFDGDNINLEGIQDFFNENEAGENWKVQASIFEKFV